MAKFTTLFLIILLCSPLIFASRPGPGFTETNPANTQHTGVETEHEAAEVVDELSCEGIEEEECLMRRTLAAHLDYIYTQKHKP